MPGQPSNADVTGSVMQSLPDTKAAQGGLSYLRKHQRPNGGFALGAGGGVNAQSTAWAVQGMIAVGADPAKISDGGSSALDYLAARQAADGHYRYSESSDQTPVWVTGQVLVAVCRRLVADRTAAAPADADDRLASGGRSAAAPRRDQPARGIRIGTANLIGCARHRRQRRADRAAPGSGRDTGVTAGAARDAGRR